MASTWTRIDEGSWINLAYCIDATEDGANPCSILVTVANGKVVRVPPGHADDLRTVLNFLAARVRAEADPGDAANSRDVRAPPSTPLSGPEALDFRPPIMPAGDPGGDRAEMP